MTQASNSMTGDLTKEQNDQIQALLVAHRQEIRESEWLYSTPEMNLWAPVPAGTTYREMIANVILSNGNIKYRLADRLRLPNHDRDTMFLLGWWGGKLFGN